MIISSKMIFSYKAIARYLKIYGYLCVSFVLFDSYCCRRYVLWEIKSDSDSTLTLLIDIAKRWNPLKWNNINILLYVFLHMYYACVCEYLCRYEGKVYIENFFNFSEAFILYAKISYSHPRNPEPKIPHLPQAAGNASSSNQNYFVPQEKFSHTKLEIRSPAAKRKL